MSIKAKITIPAEEKNIEIEKTFIDWDRQKLLFQLSSGKLYEHKLTNPQWNYLVNGLETLMNQIPGISDIEIPDFNPDI